MGRVISIVSPIYRRSQQVLDNFLLTCHWQYHQPHEVIIVDQNPDPQWQRAVRGICDRYPLAHYIQATWRGDPDWLNVAWGINVGIKATSESSDYIAILAMDMMLSSNYLNVVAQMAKPSLLLLAPCGWLPPEAPLNFVWRDWDLLVGMAAGDRETYTAPIKKWNDGTIKVAARDWWFRVHGFDEMCPFRTTSGNLNQRATKSGLSREVIPWSAAQILHQWHEPRLTLVKNTDMDRKRFSERLQLVVTNPNGWGEGDGPRES